MCRKDSCCELVIRLRIRAELFQSSAPLHQPLIYVNNPRLRRSVNPRPAFFGIHYIALFPTSVTNLASTPIAMRLPRTLAFGTSVARHCADDLASLGNK